MITTPCSIKLSYNKPLSHTRNNKYHLLALLLGFLATVFTVNHITKQPPSPSTSQGGYIQSNSGLVYSLQPLANFTLNVNWKGLSSLILLTTSSAYSWPQHLATFKAYFSVSIGSTYRIDSWPPSQLTGLWPLLVCNALACLKCTPPATTFIPVSSQLDFCLLLTGPLVNQMTGLLSVGLDWLDSLNEYRAGHPFLSGRRGQCDTLTTFLVDRPVLTAGFLLRWATSVSNNTLTQGKTT